MILLTPLVITVSLELKQSKKSIKYFHKHFPDYLSNESDPTDKYFLHPTKK